MHAVLVVVFAVSLAQQPVRPTPAPATAQERAFWRDLVAIVGGGGLIGLLTLVVGLTRRASRRAALTFLDTPDAREKIAQAVSAPPVRDQILTLLELQVAREKILAALDSKEGRQAVGAALDTRDGRAELMKLFDSDDARRVLLEGSDAVRRIRSAIDTPEVKELLVQIVLMEALFIDTDLLLNLRDLMDDEKQKETKTSVAAMNVRMPRAPKKPKR